MLPFSTVLTRSLYEEAMMKGYVEISIIKCLIFGAAGVGKTHLKHLLLKKSPPKQRISTGLAENPVRAISFSYAGVGGQDEDDWFVVEDDNALLNVIGGTIRGGMVITSSLDDVVDNLPKITVTESRNDDVIDSPAIHRKFTMHETTIEQDKVESVEEQLIHHINHSSDKVFGVKWIQFIDSGGQLQYHDILPLFIQNISTMLFVFKLSEQLSHYPIIEYYGTNGMPLIKPYQSSLSHRQILQHSLEATCSQQCHPLIVCVGTHRDIKNECKESVEAKNQLLFSLLSPLEETELHILYNGESMKEVIFPVNGKDPQEEDYAIAKMLRQGIISMSPQPMKMPIAWFGLEILLQRSAKDGVLSLDECKAYAKRLFIDGDKFTAALHHLVVHNVFLYFPNVLPNTVFCDPQVVLTKVTELVEYHHKLRDNPDDTKVATSHDAAFRNHGLLSLEILQKFHAHYRKDLFTPEYLLNLLEVLHVVSMHNDQNATKKYLMPALLPYLDNDNLRQSLPQTIPFMLRPTKGCIPSGMFCCLVTYMLSDTNPSPWKICMKREKPLCMYRNCISFIQNSIIITLYDMFSYIQVHTKETDIELCNEIRNSVHDSIKKVCSFLKYHDVKFENAFMCTGIDCEQDPPHLAIVVPCKGQPAYKWRCSIIDSQFGYLNEEQLAWMGERLVNKRKHSEDGWKEDAVIKQQKRICSK